VGATRRREKERYLDWFSGLSIFFEFEISTELWPEYLADLQKSLLLSCVLPWQEFSVNYK
jgi:hypothetical protein